MAYEFHVTLLFEQNYNREVKSYLSQARDDVPQPVKALHASSRPDTNPETVGGTSLKLGGGKPKHRLEDIERWTMVKRIF